MSIRAMGVALDWGSGSGCALNPPSPPHFMMDRLRRREHSFWDRVEKTATCWIWKGGQNSSGYGLIRLCEGGRRRSLQAHRVAFALHRGVMPDGEQLLRHRCDRPECVRPDHLGLGDHRDNVRDRVERGRCARGEANGRAKLRTEDVRTIYAALSAGESASALARRFCVDVKTICAIRDGRTWRHLRLGIA